MRKLSLILFFVGIVLATSGFLAENASNIPGILRLIAPSYNRATIGMQKLLEKGTLIPDDQGFKAIENIFLSFAAEQNPPDVIKAISVIRFKRMNAYLGFSETDVKERRPLEIELSSGQKVKWNIDSLQSEIDQVLKKGVFRYSFLLFALGAIMQILGFFVERYSSGNHK